MRKIILFCLFTVMLFHCGKSRMKIEVGGYAFDYDGNTYSIESVTPNFLEGYNLLFRKDGKKILLKGIDKEQDGILDEVAIGAVSLAEAREIYTEGILEGERRGYLRKRRFTREFTAEVGDDRLTLSTYILALGDIYNRLQVIDYQERQSVVLDRGADGILDEIEAGSGSLEHYQDLYDKMLEKGLDLLKIEKEEGRYIVVF